MAKTLVFPPELFDAVVIGDECTPPLDTSAILTLNTTTKGFLVPRLTTAQVNAIADPGEGLLVYNSDEHAFTYFNGSAWTAVGTGSGGDSGSVPPDDGGYTGPFTSDFVAGEDIPAFDLVYLKSDGKWWKANGAVEARSGGVNLGLATESKAAGFTLTTAISGAVIRNDAWTWTAGAQLYVGVTDGEITETRPDGADNVVRLVGYAGDANIIFFLPSSDWVTLN